MMLGLPRSTDVRQQISKKAVYDRFNLSAGERNRFDADIHKMFIVNEISSKTINIAEGESIKRIFVVDIQLQADRYNPKNIILLNDLIDQKMLFALRTEKQCRLAIVNGRLIEGPWKDPNEIGIELRGLNLDAVWDNIVIDVGDITVEEGKTLDEQLARDFDTFTSSLRSLHGIR
ncbi:MAG: DUF4391 domain-containing protein [Candidatus Methanomethylophilaceae archaeon]